MKNKTIPIDMDVLKKKKFKKINVRRGLDNKQSLRFLRKKCKNCQKSLCFNATCDADGNVGIIASCCSYIYKIVSYQETRWNSEILESKK